MRPLKNRSEKPKTRKNRDDIEDIISITLENNNSVLRNWTFFQFLYIHGSMHPPLKNRTKSAVR